MWKYVIAGLLLSLPLQAQEIDIQADSSVFDQKTGKHVLQGKVRMTQGALRIDAERVDVEVKDGTLHRLTATGTPVQIRDVVGDMPVTGNADSLDYDAQARIVTLNGAASVTQQERLIIGHRITVDLNSERIRAESGQTQGRVRLKFDAPQ